jgi:hypothetical protein
MQGIYNYIPETNRVSSVYTYSAAAVLNEVMFSIMLFRLCDMFCTIKLLLSVVAYMNNDQYFCYYYYYYYYYRVLLFLFGSELLNILGLIIRIMNTFVCSCFLCKYWLCCILSITK